MTPTWLSFILISNLGLIYFLIKKRNFDFFSIAFFSSILYFSPAFFGIVNDQEGSGKFTVLIIDNTYLIMIFIILFILVSAFVYDLNFRIKRSGISNESIRGSRYMTEMLLILTIVFALLTIITLNSLLLSEDKLSIVQNWGRLGTGWTYCTTLGIVSSACFKKSRYLFAFFISAFIIMLIGYRTPMVWGLIAYFTIRLNQLGSIRLLKDKFSYVVLALISVVFAMYIKKIYKHVKLLEFDKALEKKDSLFEIFMNSEPFLTQAILNKVVLYDFSIPIDHFLKLFYLPIPFTGNPEGSTFNEYFQPYLFNGVDAGLGSNIWAEMWASGGWVTLSIFLLLYVLIIGFLSKKLSMVTDPSLKALIVSVGVLWAFYIHRNGIFIELSFIRRFFYFWTIASLMSFFVFYFLPRKMKIKFFALI